MMEKQKLAILWDMDGTIIDTKACHFFCWQLSLRKFGIELDKETFDNNFGRKSQVVIPHYLGSEPDEELINQIIKEYRKILMRFVVEKSSLVPGVVSWLQGFKTLHIPQVIASSAAKETIEKLLPPFGLTEFFEHIIAGAELPAKPDPEIFLIAAKKLGYSPENCCVIEDSEAGVMAAKAAGMHCIAVATTFPRSKISLADTIIKDFRMPLFDVMDEVIGISNPAFLQA